MYKFILCWRYLRTRWIALASIISVMLGVAAMIVVNSVMAGFTTEMQNRLRGILSDLIFESTTMEGMPDPDARMQEIRQVAGDSIEAMTPAVVVPAVLSYQCRGTWMTRQVTLFGIDERTQGSVSDFSRYLQHPENRRQMSFDLRDHGFDTHDHQADVETPERTQMEKAGWVHRREMAHFLEFQREMFRKANARATAPQDQGPVDPFQDPNRQPDRAAQFDPAKEQYPGVVIGIAMASVRTSKGEDFLVLPGDDVKLTFPSAGMPPKGVSDSFTVVDFYESKMSEFDGTCVFVPIQRLQDLRGMIDPMTGVRLVSSIGIKLKPGADGTEVRDKLRRTFAPQLYRISTWRDKQSALLVAVETETAILNFIMFLIIMVAGFGVVATFYLIVVQKTRDIGILKSLGASGLGIMKIFLAYGLLLGLVGSGVGMVGGLLLVRFINPIADALGRLTGHPLFNPEVYYFFKIPTIVLPGTVAWIVAGALAVAVLASVVPACLAALLHPVEALRYE